MATLEITLSNQIYWGRWGYTTSYTSVRNAVSAIAMAENGPTVLLGQKYMAPPSYYAMYRSALRYDLTDLPVGAIISAATLKLYGRTDQCFSGEFDVAVVDGYFGDPAIYADWNNGESTSYGLINTAACAVDAYNDITINATGISALNAAIQTGKTELFLRSSKDISSTAPTGTERFYFEGYSEANPPILDLTYSIWEVEDPSEEEPPDPPLFPLQGRIDLATYAVINNFLTSLDSAVSSITGGDGNIDLAVANYITWDGTSEQIAYDNGNSRVTLTTLEATSGITVLGDLVTADPTITTTGTAVDCTVANDAQLTNAAYASILSQVADDEAVFSAGTGNPPDGECDIYMDFTTGDFMIKINEGGGTKTDILADFSAM